MSHVLLAMVLVIPVVAVPVAALLVRWANICAFRGRHDRAAPKPLSLEREAQRCDEETDGEVRSLLTAGYSMPVRRWTGRVTRRTSAMLSCVVCSFETYLDDVVLRVGEERCVCLRCYARETETELRMPLPLRQQLVASLEQSPRA